MPHPDGRFAGKRVLIMGLGRFGGGIGAARFFASHGARLTITDLKPAGKLKDSIKALAGIDADFHLGGHREEDFRAADIVCISPAVKPADTYVRNAAANGAEIVTEMGLLFETFPGSIVGITGSNGKSTTAALAYEMLRPRGDVYLGGNIGRSLLPEADTFTPESIAVIELSSFQLQRLAAGGRSPHIAVITNITPNHLDWHADYEEYVQAKAVISRFQTGDDRVIFDGASPDAVRAASAGEGIACPLTGDGPLRLTAEGVEIDHSGRRVRLFDRGRLRLPGRFNLANAALAAAAAFIAGAEPGQIAAALDRFTGLPHRLEHVATVKGVPFYNDSIATTPEAAAAAVEAVGTDAVFILGGSDKGISLEPAARAVAAVAAAAVCIGATGPVMAGLLREHARPGFRIMTAGSLEEAMEVAYDLAAGTQGAVVLSPACASFDMFINYEERGDRFRQHTAVIKAREESGNKGSVHGI